jgi:hypothetical protein
MEWDAVTRRLRETLGRLPEFSRSALHAIGKRAIDGLGELPDPGAIGLPGLSGLAVEEAARRLREAADLVREAVEGAAAVGRDAAEVGETLGIATAKFELRQLPKLAEVGRLVLQAGVVQAGWWDDTGRGELLGVATQATDQVKMATNLRRELLQAFVPSVLDHPDRGAFAGLPSVHPDHAGAGEVLMAEIRDRLARRRDELARLADAAVAVASTAGKLAELLGTSETPRQVIHITALADAAERAIDLAPVPTGLWGEARRDEIRRALAEATCLGATTEAATLDLSGRVASEALDGLFDTAVSDALRYKFWFRRLLPGWRRAKRRLLAAFPTGLTSTEQLFMDLRLLADRRLAMEQVSQLTATYRECWAFGLDGRPDGPATEAVLGRAAEAERLHPPTDRFRQVMAGPGSLQRADLVSAVEALHRAVDALKAAHTRLADHPPLRGHAAPPVVEQSRLDDMRHWAEEQADLADRHLAALDKVRAAMTPGAFDTATQSALSGWIGRIDEYANRLGYLRDVERRYHERLGLTGSVERFPDLTRLRLRPTRCRWDGSGRA